jgi:hypothetical protein
LVTHDPADAEAAGGPVIGLPHREEMVAKVLPLRNSTLRTALLWLA